MRAEKRKKYITWILVFLLVLSVPAVWLRVLLASRHMGSKEIVKLTGDHGTITDRYDTVLYDGQCKAPETVGNLIGGSPRLSKTLANLYADEIAPAGFRILSGIRSLDERVSRVMKTTLLPLKEQKWLQEAFGEYHGALFAFNYLTGEVYCMLSFPSSFADDARDGAYTNRCLSSTYIPGSTMKIITVICALEQDEELIHFKAVCTGELELPGGDVVKCHGVHGEVDLVKGIGKSCNCYMAQLISRLDVQKTRETLEKLGIRTSGEGEAAYVDRLRHTTGSTRFQSPHTFRDVWSLIGQGDSLVSVIDMALIAGCVANEGEVAVPYLVDSIYAADTGKAHYKREAGEKLRLIEKDTAKLVAQVWQQAVEKYYGTKVDPDITHAKTGTAQQGNGVTNRLLMGAMGEYHIAFYLVVEDLPSGDNRILDIANQLTAIIRQDRIRR
jgi:cell division protein FtsI/penicillin-binding protein 2